MAGNQLRGTPGMLLMAFAIAMMLVAVWGLKVKLGKAPSGEGRAPSKVAVEK